MNKQTLVLRAAECAVKEIMMEQRSAACMVAECKDSNINHIKMHTISWKDVLIGLRELESEEEQ